MNVETMTTKDLVSEALLRRPKAVLAAACEASPLMIARWLSGASAPDERETETLRKIARESLDSAPPADDPVVAVVRAAPGVDPETGEPAKGRMRCEANIKACSVSAGTVALGIEVSREHLDLLAADHSLVGNEIEARISVGDDQAALFEGMSPDAVEANADVSKISVGRATIGFRVSFKRPSVDLDAVARYAGKTALLEFRRVGPAGAEAVAEASAGVFEHGESAAQESPL